MNWLRKKLVAWLSANENTDYPIRGGELAVKERSIDSTGFNLRVYKASGGTVIETNVYDRVKDRHHNGLYVITDDKDLGAELGKIITMENLRV